MKAVAAVVHNQQAHHNVSLHGSINNDVHDGDADKSSSDDSASESSESEMVSDVDELLGIISPLYHIYS